MDPVEKEVPKEEQEKWLIARDALLDCARTEIQQALVRIHHLRFKEARLQLPKHKLKSVNRSISQLVDLFVCKSESGISLYPFSTREEQSKPTTPTPTNMETSMKEESTIPKEEEEAKLEEGDFRVKNLDHFVSILYPGAGWEYVKHAPDYYSHGEILKAQLSLELMRTVLSFVGKEMGCFEVTLKPALMQRIHDYFYQVVTLVNVEMKHINGGWRSQYQQMLMTNSEIERREKMKEWRKGKKARWDNEGGMSKSSDNETTGEGSSGTSENNSEDES